METLSPILRIVPLMLMGISLISALLRLATKKKFFGVITVICNVLILAGHFFAYVVSSGQSTPDKSLAGFVSLIYVPASFAVLQLFTRKYCYSLFAAVGCISGSLYSIPFSWRLTTGLALALIGDFFMSRNKGGKGYIPGIAFFLLAHLAFAWHSFWYEANCRIGYHLLSTPDAILIGVVAFAALTAYLILRIAPKLDKSLLLPVSAYMLVSVVSLAASSMTVALYGVAPLVVSDIAIAENDFAGNKKCGPLIMPLYFLSQIMLMLTLY